MHQTNKESSNPSKLEALSETKEKAKAKYIEAINAFNDTTHHNYTQVDMHIYIYIFNQSYIYMYIYSNSL